VTLISALLIFVALILYILGQLFLKHAMESDLRSRRFTKFFTAGLVAGLPRGPEHALRLAAACGAANALTPHSGHLDRAEVERLLAEARVEEV